MILLDSRVILHDDNIQSAFNFRSQIGIISICCSKNEKKNHEVPKNKFLHITELIEKAINKNKKVGVFPIDDDEWVDIGQWTEYKKTIDKLNLT